LLFSIPEPGKTKIRNAWFGESGSGGAGVKYFLKEISDKVF
jgi:hypothetical protein